MPNTPVWGLPYPVAADTADVPRDIKALADSLDALPSLLPVSAVFLWLLPNVPAGLLANGKPAFLICNGQLVSSADYPKLAALLGASGGNVTIPDLRDRLPLGASATRPVNTPGGEASHLITVNELPVHKHAAGALTDPSTATGGESANHSHPVSPGEYVPAHASGFFHQGVPAGNSVASVVGINGVTGLVNNLSTGTQSAGHTHTTAAHAITGDTANVGGGVAMPLAPLNHAMNYIMRAA